MLDDLLQDDPGNVEPSGELPEEGLKSPRSSSLCLGHESVEQNLLDLYAKNKLPHALVFSGPKGIGKATFAFRFARFLFHDQFSNSAESGLFGDEALPAENFSVPEESDAFQKIASGGLSDLKTIEREFDAAKGKYKGNIGVDSIRTITPFLFSTAAYGGWRIIIIDDADTMNRNAQNALLKNLEEPPKNCLIILVCHQLGRFLPTIKSRVRIYNFEPLAETNMNELLAKTNLDIPHNDKELVLRLSNGSIGLAMEFIDDGGLDVVHKILECFGQESDTQYREAAFKLAGQLGQRGADHALQSFQTFITWLARHMTTLKARGVSDLNDVELMSVFTPLYVSKTLEEWVACTDELVSHFDQCNKSNLDKHYTTYHAMELLSQ